MKFLVVLFFVVEMSIVSSSNLRQDEINSRGKRSTEGSSYFFYQQPEYPKDCKEVYDQCEGQSADGVYLIKPEDSPEPFEVYCNNSIDGGGWTVFQRRMDGSVEFYRYWNDYKKGFGFLGGEFWLGNDKISYLTNQKRYELRVDLNNVNGEPYFAKYNLFRISDEGNYDAMASNRNQSFSTRDQDNDPHSSAHCATYYHGGWWFNNCGYSWLNSLYNAGSTDIKSIYWYNLPGGQYHLKYTEMKIRPLSEI